MFKRLLRHSGVDVSVETIESGEVATKRMRQLVSEKNPPLICFLDIKMPGLNGFDVLGWIRTQPALDHMPVIMLSSSDEPMDLQEAVKRGAQCFLQKHPSPQELYAVIEEAITMTKKPTGLDVFRCPSNRFHRGSLD
jgi:CheY-like chemotaxis protein